MLNIVRVIAVIAAGLYAGIIFGDRLGATFARLAMDPSALVQFQQIQHVHFRPVLLPASRRLRCRSSPWA